MRAALLLVPILALSACGGRTDLDLTSSGDGGSMQAVATATGTSTTQTATETSYGTSTDTCQIDPFGGETCGLPTPTVSGIATVTSTGTSASCTISASNYDQSCTVDTDCVMVTIGNWCGTGCLCEPGAINASALAAFNAATAQTPVGSGLVRAENCECVAPVGSGLCCRQGLCTTYCSAELSDTLPACVDVSGVCEFTPPAGCTAFTSSTPVCAYADEVCCKGADVTR